jgi:hypothetical protein
MSPRTAREILEDVAAGRIDPAEAARLLDEVPADHRSADRPPAAEGVVHAPPPMAAQVNRLLVRATSRRVRVVSDPSVATVAVDGPHVLRRDGSTLVVTGETEIVPDTNDAFMLLAGGRWREVADRLQRGIGQQHAELRIRVRPDLATAVEVIAGSLRVDGVSALEHVRVTAGSCRVTGAESPIDLLVQAGSAQVETRQTYGRSRLRCESGSLHVTVLEGSDVRIRSDVQLGRFTTEPERRGRDRDRDIVLGTGSAELDVEAVMGGVTVKLPDPEAVR